MQKDKKKKTSKNLQNNQHKSTLAHGNRYFLRILRPPVLVTRLCDYGCRPTPRMRLCLNLPESHVHGAWSLVIEKA